MKEKETIINNLQNAYHLLMKLQFSKNFIVIDERLNIADALDHVGTALRKLGVEPIDRT